MSKTNHNRVKPFLYLLTLLLFSCAEPLDPKQIARVEQNFDKLQPGMTKEQVRELLGQPNTAEKGLGPFNSLNCKQCELWLYPAPSGVLDWPQIAFEESTQRLTKTFRAEPDKYFLF